MSTDSYPLAPIQQGMLFQWLRDRHDGTDLEQIIARLDESIDPLRLELAWQHAIDTFAILRTSFAWDGLAAPLQRIEPAAKLDFVFADLRRQSPETSAERFEQYVATDRRKGFDLGAAPAMRVALFQLGDASFTMVWSFHHILIDGRSFETILNHVFAVYAGEIPAAVPGRPYRDYIDWFQAQDQSRSREFWKRELAGFLATTSLPSDRVRGETNRYGELTASVDRETTEALRQLAADAGLSLNTILMGAWALLLARYSAESDVVFGATKTTRRGTIADADDILGVFLATIPVRISVDPEMPLVDWLKEVRSRWTALRGHEHLPLVDIKQASALPATAPLFDSLFVFENYQFGTRLSDQGGQWRSRRFSIREQTGLPLTLLAYGDAPLFLKLEFDASRFEQSTADRILGHVVTVLSSWAADRYYKVGATPMLTDDERRQVLGEWNRTEADYPRKTSLAALIEAQVALKPDAIAVEFGDALLSYRELNERANRLAHELMARGIGPDMTVGVCLERSLDLLVALLAVVKSGGAYVPLDPGFPADRLSDMAADADLSVLLTEPSLEGMIRGFPGQVVRLSDTGWNTNSDANPVVVVDPDDLAYVIYTSGTTGKPKGVEVTRGAFVNFLYAMQKAPGIDESDRLVAITTVSFDIAGLELFLPLIVGAQVVLASRATAMDGAALGRLLEQSHATILQATPVTWRLLFESGWTGDGRLKALCGGEAMPPELVEPLTCSCGSVWNMYGPTETTVWSSIHQVRAGEGAISVGRPIGNTQCYVLDRHLEPVPVGVVGELYIGGDGVARGYRKRPELTAEKFVPDPFRAGQRMYRTGDLARYHADGNLECLGRTDHQVKIRGFRIELGEIETLLKEHPGVGQAVVVAREDTPGDKRLVGYVVPSADPIAAADLRAYLKTSLPEYMVPVAFVWLANIPLSANGKIDRQALPAPEVDETSAQGEHYYVAPRTPIEEDIAEIWSAVLKRERIGVHDNFFELGGHSLLGMQVVGRMRARLNFDVPLHRLFESPTIAGLVGDETIDVPSDDEELLRLLEEIETMPETEPETER